MLQSFDTIDDLSQTAADRFCELAETAITQRGVFRVSLSGGSTPRRLYELLAGRSLPWQHVRWFWGDERNVPHDHADSNARMVREALLDKLPVENVFAWPVPVDVTDPSGSSQCYEQTLRDEFAGQSWPAWDLTLLGLGDDAHTASLFPHTDALTETDRWFVDNWVPKFEAHRYTLTAPAINSARVKMFLVSGANKRDALRHAREKSPPDVQMYPSQLIEAAEWMVTVDAV